MLYLEYFYHFTLPPDSIFLWKTAIIGDKYRSLLLVRSLVTRLVKSVILPGRTQELLIYCCLNLFVCVIV